MIVINVNPVIFSIGPLNVHWYGLMYAVGIIVGLLIAWPYARSKGITGQQLEKIVYWAIPAGLIGARLYFVLQQPLGQYISDPLNIIAVWQGGMAFYGAIFAVELTVIIMALKNKLPVWKLLDVTVIFAAVGQFFGRIGNIINGDVVGYPTHLPWGVVYANPNSLAPSHNIAYQPAAIYEAIIDIILFGILWFLRKRVKPGILFFTYIFGYSLSQIIVFFWRNNVVLLFGLKQAQLTAIGVIIIAAVVFFWFLRRQREDGVTVSSG